jgi:multiple sugar transport system ATP-binding protein
MNVRRNMGFPLLAQGLSKPEIRQRVEETAKLLQIDHILDRNVSGLAGGDRQRVALGRAIVRRPKCFLMDEPLGTLDAEFRSVMVRELRELHNRIAATTIYVTHDQLEAMAMADKIAVMNHGVIEQFGKPQEIYDHPASMYVADFIGSPPMNFISCSGGLHKGSTSVDVGGVGIRVPEVLEDVAAGDMALGARPEHIRLTEEGGIRGEVYETEYLGTNQIVAVATNDGIVKARLPADLSFRHGQNVGLELDSNRLSLFVRETGKAVRTAQQEGMSHG